jgi:hypothetical protein
MIWKRLLALALLLAALAGAGVTSCGSDSKLTGPDGDPPKPGSEQGPLGGHGTSDD